MAGKPIFEEFHARREHANEIISAEHFTPYNRFFALDSRAYEEGTLPVKMKELMGLVGSMVLRCNDCILYHIDKSVQAGASRRELNEAMNIALVIGGSIVIPHLRFAMTALEEILPQEKNPPGKNSFQQTVSPGGVEGSAGTERED